MRVLWTRADGQYRLVLHEPSAIIEEKRNSITGEWNHFVTGSWSVPYLALIEVAKERDAALAERDALRVQHGVERMSRDKAEARAERAEAFVREYAASMFRSDTRWMTELDDKARALLAPEAQR